MYFIIAGLMAAILAFAFFLLYRQELLRGIAPTILSVLLLLGAFSLRFFLLGHETLDYQWFLGPWVEHFRQHGGFFGLAYPVGNYNVPYLYVLAFFSYIPLPDLYLIKLFSILFDVILAYYVMLLVGLANNSGAMRRFAFFLILFLPTVILNGSYWGQCDSIYAAFSVMGLYYALKGRPILSMGSAALALAFKLQAVFLFPIYLFLLVARKIRLRHLPVFPITYVLAILPAVLFGRPFLDTLLIYINQANPAGRVLNYNAPSVFAFVQWTSYDPFLARLGIVAAFLFVFLVCLLVISRRRRNLSNEDFLTLALLFAIGVPFFLPHMHERYFFLADVFAVCLGLVRLRYLPAVLLTQFASLLGYHAYLEQRFFWPMRYGALALLLLLVLLFIDSTRRPRRRW